MEVKLPEIIVPAYKPQTKHSNQLEAVTFYGAPILCHQKS